MPAIQNRIIQPKARLQTCRTDLKRYVELIQLTINLFRNMADELDVHFGRINGAKIGGSSAAIIGGILATVGFGLSFVTFGASLGLSIAGNWFNTDQNL